MKSIYETGNVSYSHQSHLVCFKCLDRTSVGVNKTREIWCTVIPKEPWCERNKTLSHPLIEILDSFSLYTHQSLWRIMRIVLCIAFSYICCRNPYSADTFYSYL